MVLLLAEAVSLKSVRPLKLLVILAAPAVALLENSVFEVSLLTIFDWPAVEFS